jgi:hypothetical protein
MTLKQVGQDSYKKTVYVDLIYLSDS